MLRFPELMTFTLTQMWFKHIKADEVVNGATAVDLRAGFGDKSFGSVVLNKYKVATIPRPLFTRFGGTLKIVRTVLLKIVLKENYC